MENKIFEYICLNETTTTNDIMDKFKLNVYEAKEILQKLYKVYGLIKPSFIIDNPEKKECHWTKTGRK